MNTAVVLHSVTVKVVAHLAMLDRLCRHSVEHGGSLGVGVAHLKVGARDTSLEVLLATLCTT